MRPKVIFKDGSATSFAAKIRKAISGRSLCKMAVRKICERYFFQNRRRIQMFCFKLRPQIAKRFYLSKSGGLFLRIDDGILLQVHRISRVRKNKGMIAKTEKIIYALLTQSPSERSLTALPFTDLSKVSDISSMISFPKNDLK